MKKNKKSAIESSTLVLYIILIVVALSLIGVVTLYVGLATKDVKKKACEWDITKAALSKKIPDVTELLIRGHRLTSLTNCRRDKLGNLVIRYEDIVENGIINQNKAHKIIVDEMVECWKMAGQGKIDPFSNWEGKGESYCMVCSTIKFDKKLNELYNKGVKKNEEGKNVMSEEDFKKYRIQPIYNYLMGKEVEKGKSFWGFLYNKEAIKYKETSDNNYIIPESTIIIQMYKLESKGWVVTKMVIGGVAIVGGLVLSSTGIGAIIGVPLITGIVGATGIAIGVTGISMVVHATSDAYKECEECNAIGGIQLVPPEQEFNMEIEVKLGDKEKKIPLCSIIVN